MGDDIEDVVWPSAGLATLTTVYGMIVYDEPSRRQRLVSWLCRVPGTRWVARRWGIRVTWVPGADL